MIVFIIVTAVLMHLFHVHQSTIGKIGHAWLELVKHTIKIGIIFMIVIPLLMSATCLFSVWIIFN